MQSARVLGVVLMAICWCSVAAAEDRALLVGVGRYKEGVDPTQCRSGVLCNLPGVDKDLEMMRGVTAALGIRPAQIKVLLNEQATLANIRAEFDRWLIGGAGPGDRVLFYYSGHGSQIADTSGEEADNLDEVLLPYDTHLGTDALENVLVDDELGEWLARVRSNATLALVDACHSGSVTKSVTRGNNDAVVKFVEYAGMPRRALTRSGESGGIFLKSQSTDRYVSLTAAADNEESLASPRGSYFTLGIARAVAAAQAQRALTALEMRDVAAAEIQRLAPANRVHNPQLAGNDSLLRWNLFARPADVAAGDLWADLEHLADTAPEQFAIVVRKTGESAARDTFSSRDTMEIVVTLSKPGYLNVISVSAITKTAVVLFPNRLAPQNRVDQPASLVIPPAGARYEFGMALPPGAAEERNLLVVLETDQPLNASEQGTGPDIFRELSARAVASTRGAVLREKGYSAGKVVYVLR